MKLDYKNKVLEISSKRRQDDEQLIGVLRDVTERTWAAEALQASEDRYRNIFQTTAVSIWEEDFSEVKTAIDAVKASGVVDFRAYLDAHPQFEAEAVKMVKILDVNDASLKMYGAQSKEVLITSLHQTFVPESLTVFREELIAIAEGHPYFSAEAVTQTLQGDLIDILITITFPTKNESWNNVSVSMMDITERKQATKALERQAHILGERVKELHGLYELSGLINQPNITLEEIFQGTVDLIPAAWQYPEITCAQIVMDKQQYKTDNFSETDWKLTSPIKANGTSVGRLEVCYLEERSAANEGPFMKEERNLIVAMSEQLGMVIERKQAEISLRKRAQQQAIVAQLGQRALATPPLFMLFDEAVTLVADTLEATYCKVLELLPDEEAMLMRAGVGWREGLVGTGTVDIGLDSQAGFTLLANEPVVVVDLATDTRFGGPPLLRKHGVVSGMSTIIGGVGRGKRPFGILGVHTTQQRDFSVDDVNFLQAIANVLSEAVVREQVQDALRESEGRYRLLVDSSPDGIALHSHSRLIYANNAFARLLGANKPDDLLDKNVQEIVHPDHWEITIARGRRMMAGEQGLYPAEDVYVRLDGTAVPVEVIAVPLAGEGETAVQVIVRDITERRKNEEELRQYRTNLENLIIERTSELQQRVSEVEQLNNGMLNLLADLQNANENVTKTAQQLEESNVELESFAYSISHDLRAPLRHITGFATMLMKREKEQLDDVSARYLNIVNEAANKMGQLIDDLLSFSRMGRQALHMQPVNVTQLVSVIQRDVVLGLSERTIVWEIDELPMVMADPGLLHQVWINLLENSVKYSATRAEATIQISTLPADESGMITFSVRDNGVGFDPNYMDKLFGVFQRLHGDDEFEGTGIGLATVRRIINRHGGKVWAEGELDEGASFYFTLQSVEE